MIGLWRSYGEEERREGKKAKTVQLCTVYVEAPVGGGALHGVADVYGHTRILHGHGVEGGRVGVSTTLCAPAVEGGGSPIRRGHPEQQGMVTVTRMDGLR